MHRCGFPFAMEMQQAAEIKMPVVRKCNYESQKKCIPFYVTYVLVQICFSFIHISLQE